MDYKERIRTYILENILLGSTEKTFADDDSFLEKGLIDSTGILELVAFIEDEFGFDVADDELIPDNFDSVGRLAMYVQKKKGGAGR
ncbi:MAG: acyl carrier protein [Candidatus Krumholzibacteria bacterium]|nr:acyl carrier protein [Candidatus Krumholzibacteria bacterium]